MENQELARVEWRNQPVLTTNQLAEAYGCAPKNISKNFRYAKEYFVEGVHYFKLTGEDLRQFKRLLSGHSTKSSSAIHTYSSVAYLWTYQGCARHCKMINNTKAWDVFNVLEQAYFGMPQGESEALLPPAVDTELETLKERVQKQFAVSDKFDLAVVYVLLLSNLTVKIGLTKDLTERIQQIKAETHLDVLNYCTTKFMSREDAERLEAALKEKFAAYCIGGEYFDVKFSIVCAEI